MSAPEFKKIHPSTEEQRQLVQSFKVRGYTLQVREIRKPKGGREYQAIASSSGSDPINMGYFNTPDDAFRAADRQLPIL
jgi:hypothetical protein